MVWQQLQQAQQAGTQYESECGDNTDVPAGQLADKDSLFVDINGLEVHYKQACPTQVPLHPAAKGKPSGMVVVELIKSGRTLATLSQLRLVFVRESPSPSYSPCLL